jgi:tetratricopeptide (TPR) repeat protein
VAERIAWIVSLLLLLGTVSDTVGAQQKSLSKGRPDRAQKHFELGNQLSAWQDRLEPAIPEYLLAIKLRRGVFPVAWFNLSRVYGELFRFPDALDALQRFAKQTKKPDSQVVDEQIPMLTRAIAAQNEIDSGQDLSAAPFVTLSQALRDYGRYDKALEYTEAALKKYRDSVDANLELFRIHRSSPERIEEVISNALDLAPDRADVHAAAGTFYLADKRIPNEAIREYRSAIAIDPQYAGAWLGLGQSLLYNGEPKEAAAAYRKYLAFRKNSIAAECDPTITIEKIEKLESQ